MNERLSLEIAAKAIGQESIDQLNASLTRFSDIAESGGKRAALGLKQVSSAADESTGSMRRLFLAVKDLGEGRNAFATVEAGYFIQSLGGIATAAGFAVAGIGAIAYGVSRVNKEIAEGAPKMARAFDDMNGSLAKSNDELRLSLDRLENEKAKLENKPQNNIKLALDEAKLSADELGGSLRKAMEALDGIFKQNGVTSLKGILTRQVSTDPIENDVRAMQIRIDRINREGQTAVGAAGSKSRAKSAQLDYDTNLKSELDADIKAASDLVDKYELLTKFQKQGLSPEESRSYSKRFGAIDATSVDAQRALISASGVLESLNSQREEVSLRSGIRTIQPQVDKLKEDNELAESRKRLAAEAKAERDKEQTMLKGGMDETLGQLKRDHDLVLGEESSFWTIRLAEVDKFGGRYVNLHKEIIDRLGSLAQERGALNKRVANELNSAVTEGWDRISKEQDETAKRTGEGVVSSANEGSRTLDLASRGVLDSRLANLDIQRRGIQRASALTPAGSSESAIVAARIADSQKLQQIDQQEGQLRLNEEAKLLARMDDADTKAREIQKDKIIGIARETNQKVYDDTTHTLELIHAEQLRQMSDFKGEIGSLFDAATSHQPKALQNLIREQVMGVGRKLAEDAAVTFVLPTIKSIAPGLLDPSGSIAKFLHIGGGATPVDPHKIAVDADTQALRDHTAAPAQSVTGGGGGVPSASGIKAAIAAMGGGAFGAFDSASGTYSGIGSPAGDIGDGLPMASGPWGATGSLGSLGKTSFGSSALGKNIGLGIAAAGGAFAAFNDFKSGGAKNDIAGVGAGLGSAAAIAAMIPGGQIAALGLGIASAATSLIAAVMPDPHVVRENAINKAIAQQTYQAPQALNVTQSSGGTFADFDARGNLRQSSFSPYPQVTQGYMWAQSHGTFSGIPDTYYQVPGGQTAQFGSTVPPTVHVHINSIDSQSGAEFVMKQHVAIGDAVVKGIQGAHGSLTTAVKNAAIYG